MDIVKHGRTHLWQIDFLEFMELVARAASLICPERDVDGTILQLHEKVNRVLDEWLPLVGCQRHEPEYYETVGQDEDSSDQSC